MGSGDILKHQSYIVTLLDKAYLYREMEVTNTQTQTFINYCYFVERMILAFNQMLEKAKMKFTSLEI